MEFGNAAQLFGERCCVEELSCCVRCAGARGGIRREELSRRNGLAMRDDKVTHQRDLTADLQPLGPWLAQSHGDGEPRGVVIVETPGNGACRTGKADRR